MKVALVYARIYAACLRKALLGIRKNLWTLLLPAALFIALTLLEAPLARLGMVGGFIYSLASSALYGAYLYFVGEVVASLKVSVGEVRQALGRYLWSVVSLFFVLWLARYVFAMLVQRSANAGLLMLLFNLAAFILLNPAPEVIYQRGTVGGMATVTRSITFIQAAWIEWFIPNLLLGGLYFFVLAPALSRLDTGVVAASGLIIGPLLHVAMIFRGHLFAELDGSSHRQRMFKFRTGQG